MKGKKRRVSLIRQRDSTDCGPACLSSIAAGYGYYIAVSRVRQLAGTDQNGTSVAGITDAAILLGFDVKGVKASYDAMTTTIMPAIAHCILKPEPGHTGTDASNSIAVSHFMVVTLANSRFVKVMDPAEGKIKRITKDAFLSIWTGVAILLVPGKNFITNERADITQRIKAIAFPVKDHLILGTFCSVISSVLGLSLSFFVKEIFDIVVPSKNLSIAHAAAAVVIFIVAVQFVLGNMKVRSILLSTRKLNSALVMEYYTHVMKLPVSYFKSMRAGDIVSRLNDTAKITAAINDFAVNILVDVLTLVCSLVFMFSYNWKIACVISLVIPVYAFLYMMTEKINRRYQRGVVEAGADVEAHLVESINNTVAIRHLGIEDHFIASTYEKLSALLDRSFAYGSKQLRVQNAADAISKVFTILLIWIGSYYIIRQQMTAGELMAFYTLLGYFSIPVLYLLGSLKNFEEARIASIRLSETLALEHRVYGRKNVSFRKPVIIEFRDMTFAYANGNPVLKNINLKFEGGKITGITGKSGTGKSTLLSLILGDYPPAKGEITFDGVDIRELDKKTINALIAIAPQEPVLFSGTIAENILIGQHYEPERLIEISQRLSIDEIGADTVKGMGVFIHEGGKNLSGGQKQRISLARALYRNAPVLMLDEATAAIDEESERKIMQTIDWYKNKGNTVIIVAHSESTLKICDNIAVLEDGYIT